MRLHNEEPYKSAAPDALNYAREMVHPFIIGELVSVLLKNRSETLRLLYELPRGLHRAPPGSLETCWIKQALLGKHWVNRGSSDCISTIYESKDDHKGSGPGKGSDFSRRVADMIDLWEAYAWLHFRSLSANLQLFRWFEGNLLVSNPSRMRSWWRQSLTGLAFLL